MSVFLRACEGRGGRWEYVFCGLPFQLAPILAWVLPLGALRRVAVIISIVVWVLAGLPIAVRRLHDMNKSAWWVLWSFVPVFNLALLLGLTFHQGTIGASRFGEPDAARDLIG